MKWKQALLGAAAMLVFLAANAHAQTLTLAIIGSSAQFLEEGQAAGDPATGLGCYWTYGSKNAIEAADTATGAIGSGATLDGGTVWVAWSAGTGGTCGSPASSSSVYMFLNTDSVVGNRCFFRANTDSTTGCVIDVVNNPSGIAGSGLFGTGFTDTALPSSVESAISGKHFNAAATDIRPEDAKFAINRVLASGGTEMSTGSQYIGLGYANGGTIKGSTLGGGSSFNVLNFNITGDDPFNTSEPVPAFTVTTLGAVPIVVLVNPGSEAGFGNLAVTNLTRATLAGYLDGTYGFTGDAIETQGYASTSKGNAATVFIREPLSGTYNTMEYGVPNNREIQSSQDCGLEAYNAANSLWISNSGTESSVATPLITPPWNCSGGAEPNPLGSGAGTVNRAIGTGNEIASVLANTDSIGYGFWSAANFAGATPAKGKYLTIDGVDPIQEVWVDGEVPTSSNGLLGNVSLSHVKDGSYPIWSVLRIVSTTGVASNVAALIADAQRFLSPSQPDFVPNSQLFIVRSHFAPPGVAFPGCPAGYSPAVGDDAVTGGTACPQGSVNNGDAGGTAESGGDVGGMIYSFQSDGDYNNTNGVSTGHIGKRQ
jgi:hypothetical protein